MKKCGKCKEVKDSSCFGKQSSKPDGLQAQCKDCRRAYNKEHYTNNKSSYATKRLANQRKYRNEFNEFKSTLSCKICSESEPICLDFHHLDPTEKESGVASMIGNVSKEKIQEEISKCIVLCANCHRKVHAGIITV